MDSEIYQHFSYFMRLPPDRLTYIHVRWLTIVTHHDMCHQNGTGNYGLYSMLWDRWLGTEHSSYKDNYRYITEQRELAQ